MTYNVSSGMLNPTIPYHTILCVLYVSANILKSYWMLSMLSLKVATFG